jgi:CheY-like chemotaxis protein
MDGFALARTIQRMPGKAHTSLIMITAFDMQGQGEQALQAGFSSYLSKPIKQTQLLDSIQQAISKRAASLMDIDKTQGLPRKVVSTTNELKLGRLILLVEDNSANQILTMRQLHSLGYTAHVAANGLEAIEAKSRLNYGLILMDCHMPEMDGFQATRAIREIEAKTGQHIPIVAMTANAMQGTRESCLACGMDDYLSKPVSLERLGEMLKNWLPQ